MDSHPALPHAPPPGWPATGEIAKKLRKDEQPAVGPAPALDDQGAVVRRGRAVGEALRMVVQPPAASDEIDAGLGVLDDGAILNELAYEPAVVERVPGDGLERGLAQERVGADPVRRVVGREALVDDVLDVGRRSRDALHRRRGAGYRTVGRLRDRDALVAGLLHHVDQPARVARQEQAVGIEREDIWSVRELAPGLVLADGDEVQTARSADGDPARAHQRDVGVEVHRLVRSMREVDEALALEARDLHVEERSQTEEAALQLL